jgi:hypothetical protein
LSQVPATTVCNRGAEGHRRHRHGVAHQHHVLDVLPVENLGGDHEHDRRGGDPHQKGEVSDVETPADLVAQVGDRQPYRLRQVRARRVAFFPDPGWAQLRIPPMQPVFPLPVGYLLIPVDS